MITSRLAFLLLMSAATIRAGGPDYDAELQHAMKLYPPGDYSGIPARRFPATPAVENFKAAPGLTLREPVEPYSKDTKTLLSEAADYFTSGRWDLSEKRYRQLLLIDPDNKDARANLYDVAVLRSMYDLHLKDAAEKHRELRARLLKDIIPKK